LFVAFEIGVAQNEIHFILTELQDVYFVTIVCLFEGGFDGHSRSMYLFWPFGR